MLHRASPAASSPLSLAPASEIHAEGGPSGLPTTPAGGGLKPNLNSRASRGDAYVSAFCVECGEPLQASAAPCAVCGQPVPSRLEFAA